MASNPSGPQGDAKFVRELAKILKDTDLTEIEVERGDLKIRVAREFRRPRPSTTPPPRLRRRPPLRR